MSEYVDQPPAGWFVLDVMRQRPRGSDWAALMIDIDPDGDDFREWQRPVCWCFVRIAGKHRNRDAAWDALENMRATRH